MKHHYKLLNVFFALNFLSFLHTNTMQEKPILFEAQKNGKTIFLTGTMHLPGLTKSLHVKTLDCFYKSNIVLTELEDEAAEKENLYSEPFFKDIPDGFFMQTAKEQNKELIGLDTLDLQKNLCASLNVSDEQIKAAEKIFKPLYIAGDLQTIHNIITLVKAQAPIEQQDLMKQLFTDRNIGWTYKINELVAAPNGNHPIFIAVGAGHLLGEDGLINLLKKDGYLFKE